MGIVVVVDIKKLLSGSILQVIVNKIVSIFPSGQNKHSELSQM